MESGEVEFRRNHQEGKRKEYRWKFPRLIVFLRHQYAYWEKQVQRNIFRNWTWDSIPAYIDNGIERRKQFIDPE